MNEQEYNLQLKEIEENYIKQKRDLAVKYAFANNPHKVGDIITDHIGKIEIESIKVDIYSKPPRCVYFGIELKKDGTPPKRLSKRNCWQTNLIMQESK